MRSKILDAIVRNQNKDLIPVVNTSMDIDVDWDASLKEDGGSMLLDIVINNIKGSYNYTEHKSGFERITTIKFSTNSDWKINTDTSGVTFPLSPASAEIDVYSKTLKITF